MLPSGSSPSIHNPYARKRRKIIRASDEFDSVCLPDQVLIEALEQAELQDHQCKQQHAVTAASLSRSPAPTTTAEPLSTPRNISQSTQGDEADSNVGLNDDDDDECASSSSPPPPSLTQMIEHDDTNDDEDPTRQRLRQHCLELRSRLEKFVKRQITEIKLEASKERSSSLMTMINTLQRRNVVSPQLAACMHQIRELGNIAAHRDHELPSRDKVEPIVARYLELKSEFERNPRWQDIKIGS